MDLTKYNVEVTAEQGAWMELESPVDGEVLMTDKNEPVRIKLLGTDSKVWRNKNRETQRARINSMVRKKAKNIDYTISDEDACEMLAECTIEWSGIDEKGKALEFSEEAARDLYTRYIWVREQVDIFINDRANFFPNA